MNLYEQGNFAKLYNSFDMYIKKLPLAVKNV